MTDPVLRCPNCGTTQAHAGECDACHESDVRWFCPNHAPGRWLDSPSCPECAARVARESADREREAWIDREREKLEEIRRPPPPPAPARRPTRFPFPDIGLPRRTRGRPRLDGGWIEVPGGPTSIDEPPRPEIRIPGLRVVGCFGRLVMTVIMIVVLLALGTCFFFGPVVQIGARESEPSHPVIVVGSSPDVRQP